ncbi:cytochrome c biogenesis protein CcdA [Thermodesulfobacteriota bacterium]
MLKLIIKWSVGLVLIGAVLHVRGAIAQQAFEGFDSLRNKPAAKEIAVDAAWSVDRAHPGDRVILAIILNIKKGFHINPDTEQIVPSEDFKPYPTRVKVIEAPEGVAIEAPRYPRAQPVKVDYAGGSVMSFVGQTVIYQPIQVGERIDPGSLAFKITVEYQACDAKSCLFPEKIILNENLQVIGKNAAATEINRDIFANFDNTVPAEDSKAVGFDLFGWSFSVDVSSGAGLLLLLITAAFGGFLLNFTPCVLPLVPIKIIGLSHAAEDRKKCFILGASMFFGVLSFWLGLGAMIAMVSGFTATNQLFQYPLFTISVGLFIAVMAVGMCGLFHIRLPNFIYMINPSHENLHGSFVLGILTAILSTPCTAPFMGAAAAWAATRHPVTTLITFAAIGVGMALPYLLLSASPDLLKRMPRTGPASVLIKEVMGLFMLGAAAYFIGSGLSAFWVSPPSPPSKIYWWSVVVFCSAAGGWLAYRTIRITERKGLRTFFVALGITIIAGSAAAGLRLTDKGPIDWVYYTPERFADAVRQRKIVVLDFTAEWCLNCKALEEGVLHSRRVRKLFADEDIVPIKVDITGNNPAGKAKLKKVGILTIPLLVIYDPDGREVFKKDFYTVDQVMQAIAEARGNPI